MSQQKQPLLDDQQPGSYKVYKMSGQDFQDSNISNNPHKSFAEKKGIAKRSMFQMPFEDQAILEHEIQDAKNMLDDANLQMSVTDLNRQSIIQDRKVSVVQERKSTNIQVILAITNTMVGSVALCLPYSWYSGGFLASLIIMLFMGVISFITCLVLVVVQRRGDTDLAQIVSRLLNEKWAKTFGICSALLLFIASIVYFMLQNQVLYAFIKFVVANIDEETEQNMPDISQRVFDRFSVQYQCIILAVPIFFIISMKELSFIIKLGQYGVLAILCYGVFIIYLFITNVTDSNFSENWKKMKMWPEDFKDVTSVTGNFSLAFFLHNGITTILANSQYLEKKTSNTFWGYFNVLVIYGFVGIFGSIGLLNLDDLQNPPFAVQTVMQLFPPKQVFPAIVNLLFLFQLSTALPILCFISRSQLFALIFGQNESYPHKYNIMYNGIFMLFAVGCQIGSVDPSILIGIDGAVCGFYMVYLLPFFVRMKSYGVEKELSKTPPRRSFVSQNGQSPDREREKLVQNRVNEVSTYSSENMGQLESAVGSNNKLEDSEDKEIPYQKLSGFEYFVWGIIVLVGLAMGGLQIVGVIE